jgi:hypothetical protein
MAITPGFLCFYCLADCWMSWNAAKRALSLGYSNVAWYREGNRRLARRRPSAEEAAPEPRPDE